MALALFYERIRERLQQVADDALATGLDAAVAVLQTQPDIWLDGHGRVDFSDVSLTALEVELAEQRVGLRGQASGKVQVVIECEPLHTLRGADMRKGMRDSKTPCLFL